MAPVIRSYILKETVKKRILIVQDQDVMDSLKLSPDTVKTMIRGGISTKDINVANSIPNADSNVFVWTSPSRKFFKNDKDHRGSHLGMKAKTMKAKPRKKKLNVFRIDKSLWQTARSSHKKEEFFDKVDFPGNAKPAATNAEIRNDSSPKAKANQSMIPIRARKIPTLGRHDSMEDKRIESPKMSSTESKNFKDEEYGGRSKYGKRRDGDENSDNEDNSNELPILCCSVEEDDVNLSVDGETRKRGLETERPKTKPELQGAEGNEQPAEIIFLSNRHSPRETEASRSTDLQHSPESFYGFPCLGETTCSSVLQVPTDPSGQFTVLHESSNEANPEKIAEQSEPCKEWLMKLRTGQMNCSARRRAFSLNDTLLRTTPEIVEIENLAALRKKITQTSSTAVQASTDTIDAGCQTEEADLHLKVHLDISSMGLPSQKSSPSFQEVSKSFERLAISCSTPHIDNKLEKSHDATDETERPVFEVESFAANDNFSKHETESQNQLSSGVMQCTPTQIEEHPWQDASRTKSSTVIQASCQENEGVIIQSLGHEDNKDCPSLNKVSLTSRLSPPCTPKAKLIELADVAAEGNLESVADHTKENTSRSSSSCELVTPAGSTAQEPEVDSEGDTVGHLTPLAHWILPPGKKYRRSLSIIRHLEGSPRLSVEKGRNYEQSVEQVIKLQSRMRNSSEATPLQTWRKRLSASSSLMKQRTPRMTKQSLFVRSPRIPKASRFTLYETPRASFCSPIPNAGVKVTPEDKIKPDNEPERTPEGVAEDFSTPQTSSSSPSSQSPVYTIVDLILTICKQTEPCSFSDILSDESYEGGCKLGEGVFGEVFSVNRDDEMTVLKIIPIEGTLLVNGEKQKTYSEILSEIVIAKVLHELRFNDTDEDNVSSGFAELIELSLVQGRYPEQFLKFWREFDETKGSDNDYPNIFSKDQLFIVLEQSNGGKDLEIHTFSTAKQALSVFKQIVFSLAAAECSVEFEHRDLHWGNVLVSKTSSKQLSYTIKGQTYSVPTHGVKSTIIDYTLSRIKYINQFPIYNDIGKDPGMFIATGDYQFDVYRLMKDDVADDWSTFAPKTNVRWLVYLVEKMTSQVKYSRTSSKIHRDSIKVFGEISTWIESCDSAFSAALKLAEA